MGILLMVLVSLAVGVVVIVAGIWLVGFVRGSIGGDRLVSRAPRPVITVERATTEVVQGGTATIQVHIEGGEKCWIAWAAPRAHAARAPDQPVRISTRDSPLWSCAIGENTRPGLWSVTVTAEGPKGRSRVIVPVRIHADNAGDDQQPHEFVAVRGRHESAYAAPRVDVERPSPN